MPSLTPLQQLCRLNSSSPDQFPEQLTSLLHQRGYREGVTSLQDEDLLQLVEHLDHVLGTLHPASPAFWKCLREVRAICGNRKVLPQSHRLPDSLLSTAEWPIASRGPCDVYEGLLDGLKVSVKRLRIYSRERPKDIQHAFFQEAIVWKHLVHPNIVPLLGVTTTPFQFVSVWMPGGELSEYIGLHPRADRLGLASDVANGLSYLHSNNVIHGDLKGPSILVDDIGHARLTDFGLAAVAPDFESAVSLTESHAVRWAAPEILSQERSVSKESDIYSFAMVAIEIFTGKVPYYDSTPTAVAVDVLSGNRPERPMHPSLTDDLWNMTKHCWNSDPQCRPDISEVALRLQTTFAPQHGDDTTPDDTTLGSVERKLSSESHYEPPRSIPETCKLRRLWKLDKPSILSRHTPGGDPTRDAGSEKYKKSINMKHKSFGASDSRGRRGRWFPRCETPRERHDRLNNVPEKQEAGPTGDGVPSSQARNHTISFKSSLMQLRYFPSSLFKKYGIL